MAGAPEGPRRITSLSPPAPTPSRGRTALAYELAREQLVSLDILDAQGRLARTLVPERMEVAGPHRLSWDGRDADGREAAPGVYLAVLHAGEQRLVRRLVIVR